MSLLFACGTMSFLFAACTDDTFPETSKYSDNQISFDVSTVNFKTRSGQMVRTGGAIPLTADGADGLWLNPTITPGFEVGVATTRSASVNTSTVESFGVYAMIPGQSQPYMDNVEITKANGWAPEQEYLWPGKENLTFFSYSPYGMVSKDDEGGNVIVYSTPTDVKDQKDILWGTPVKASSSPCKIELNHALTAVRFVAGAEMSPCSVKSIKVSGVPADGTLNISDGSWWDVKTPTDFEVVPVNPDLTAESGSQYVAENTPITATDEALLLLPGILPDDATVTLTIDINGNESQYTASIGGQEWPEGTTVTYRLSAKPDENRLILDVLGTFETEYPGQTVPFRVKSCYVNAQGDTIPVAWKAEFVDESGNPLGGTPEWIKEFPMTGFGMDKTKAVTKMQRLTFTKLSEQSQILQDTPDINSTSGQTPYNLANSTGAPSIENTANCYIVNAPGKYSLPLVYGNGIKNGVDNKTAYTTTTHNSNALKDFLNHLGKGITSPYIYLNSCCESPADASLVWEGRLDLIRNVTLNADHTITFEVPAESIRQGNAIIALNDKDGNVMWSWNIWVTDYKPDSDLAPVTYNGMTHNYYTRNIGRIMGGDVTVFPHCETWVRFTQTGDIPEGMEPLTTTIDFNQTGITTVTEDCYNFYQWGRKDPMKSAMNEWFDEDHYEIKTFRTEQLTTVANAANYPVAYILHPDVFFQTEHTYPYDYYNLWNMTLNTHDNVKTIYDPSPVGAKVPLGADLLALINAKQIAGEYVSATNGSHSMGFKFTLSNGTTLFFPELGYRSGATGNDLQGYGQIGTFWLAGTSNKMEAHCILLQQDKIQNVTDPRAHGFGVRPVKE